MRTKYGPHFYIGIMLLTLLTAILLQVLFNLANNYSDTLKGADKVN